MAEPETIEVSSSDDDLWTYGGGGADNSQEEEAAEDEPEEDDLDVYLPQHKRAKLAVERGRATRRPDDGGLKEVMLISDDEAEPGSQAGPSGTAQKPKDDDDDWGLEEPSPGIIVARQAPEDPDLAELLRQNSEAMQSLERATKEAMVTVGDLDVEDRVTIDDDDSDDDPGDLPCAGGGDGFAPSGGDKLVLCLRCGEGKEIKLRVSKNDTFEKLLGPFRTNAVKKGWLSSEATPVKFMFDGEAVTLSATPASLDCEDDDVNTRMKVLGVSWGKPSVS